MAKLPLIMDESSEKLYYKHSPTKDHGHESYPERSNGMSFFAFVFSVFIYTSVFYVLDISPSTLFSNTKFWFFISNTLILIIAADYGAFSSSKRKQLDFYEEFVTAQRTSRPGAPVWQASRAEPVLELVNVEKLQEKRVDELVEPENGTERKELVVFGGDPLEKSEETCNEVEIEDDRTSHENKLSDDKTGNEEENFVSEANDELVKVIDEGDEGEETERDEGEVDEYSAMSDEELNKRVDEFILKLKRQIRLQGVRGYG
ncbi:uncharacterized protein LOC116192274 [Punica granatum]|uniref:Uncharacterized protein n=2 Tax=Punica granatum TaxID=22663 RepID=A0A218XLE7_PUNGR|nr:uncharacterized protein LOC116192274 [Punica granatum]OWM85489.1 hypothetical protein CDL15_Pgr019113 [Punica granatum]PKI31136.1 hypothetical protein CRG98_048478 [Punica granatum]